MDFEVEGQRKKGRSKNEREVKERKGGQRKKGRLKKEMEIKERKGVKDRKGSKTERGVK